MCECVVGEEGEEGESSIVFKSSKRKKQKCATTLNERKIYLCDGGWVLLVCGGV